MGEVGEASRRKERSKRKAKRKETDKEKVGKL